VSLNLGIGVPTLDASLTFFSGIYSPIHVLRLKITDFEPKKHIMNPIGLGQNAVCTGR